MRTASYRQLGAVAEDLNDVQKFIKFAPKILRGTIEKDALGEDRRGQNWISTKKDKFIFSRGMVSDIAFNQHVRVALDGGCGVAITFSSSAADGSWAARWLRIESQDTPQVRANACHVEVPHMSKSRMSRTAAAVRGPLLVRRAAVHKQQLQ
ncbi:S-adenosyl-L-methionine-dependent methyltransferase [Artemisia annua]|uniref:S-adenosyl-L-methionine-dependent methyltransferase n=1 Tax=Artemisia annua TaxID=35608 RepID=A0A2U1NG33_ARTAN|nr:S-adenosyl-L-methionine-dependent methyltransferase [Artemisia annua]